VAEPGAAPRRAAIAAAVAVLAAAATRAAQPAPSGLEGPDAVRDQNPLLRPYYLPTARLAPAQGTDYGAGLAWSNTVNLPYSATERLYVDEETAELDLRATWRSGDWLAATEVPLVVRGGGILDGVIDDWHSLLGVNKGSRPYVQSNSYRITYQGLGQPPVSVARGAALGDIPLEAGRLLYGAPGAELSAWLGVKLPSGSRDHATGSGSADVALWLAGGHTVGTRVDLSLQAGVMRAGGNGEYTRIHREVGFGTLALAVRAGDAVSLIAQADAHSALPYSGLNFFQPALVGTLGARFRVGRNLALDAGFQEDLATNRSPDITLYLALRRAATAR